MAIRIGVGSTNPVKVAAVRGVALKVWCDDDIQAVSVDPGVSEMPMSDADGITGARQRARTALDKTGADLGIGLEGAVIEPGAELGVSGLYLTNWVVVVGRDGRLSLGSGGRLSLPKPIAEALRAGAELGPIMDRCAGEADSKLRLGASGHLALGIVPREEVFRLAVAFALAPFLRRELYDDGIVCERAGG